MAPHRSNWHVPPQSPRDKTYTTPGHCVTWPAPHPTKRTPQKPPVRACVHAGKPAPRNFSPQAAADCCTHVHLIGLHVLRSAEPLHGPAIQQPAHTTPQNATVLRTNPKLGADTHQRDPPPVHQRREDLADCTRGMHKLSPSSAGKTVHHWTVRTPPRDPERHATPHHAALERQQQGLPAAARSSSGQ